MAIELGKDLKIKFGPYVWAYASSFEYSVDNRIIKTNAIGSGEWDTYMQYGKGWTGSCDTLVCRPSDSSGNTSYLENHILTSNASLGIEFINIDTSTIKRGSIFFTSFKQSNGGDDQPLTASVSFTGTGPLA